MYLTRITAAGMFHYLVDKREVIWTGTGEKKNHARIVGRNPRAWKFKTHLDSGAAAIDVTLHGSVEKAMELYASH
jgi:hypothetical protein